MFVRNACLVLSSLGACAAQAVGLREVQSAFDRAHIPQDLQITFDPKAFLDVGFPSGEVLTAPGAQFPRKNTAGPPTFVSGGDLGAGPFVIAAVDPDAPTPQAPTISQFRHFLGGNFFLKDRETGILSNTTAAISEFNQPAPPARSDPHRYIFLLFNQPRGFNSQRIVTQTTGITKFNISAFAEAVGLGEPIAGNFMVVGPDSPTA